MPLFKIDAGSLSKVEYKTFEEVGVKERQHLQALFRDSVKLIWGDLLILNEEFSDWLDSERRVDLLALDTDRNLVVIELKRVEGGGHMELQALRYAAMVSAMDFDAVVKT